MLLGTNNIEPLGINQGEYRGESIDIQAVLAEILEAARRRGWQVEEFGQTPLLPLTALRRTSADGRVNIYLSTGIHGDEPAGPLAMRELLRNNLWPSKADLWLCPCLNPTGFSTNRRANADGVDLNRDYRLPVTQEVQAHIAWLQRQPRFDVSICLHEDWEARGFYLYELNPEGRPSQAERIVSAVGPVCPIDNSPVIEGRPAEHGIIRPDLDAGTRPRWAEAFYLIQHKTHHSYTLEAPSDYALPVRVSALVTAVETALSLVL